MNSTNSRLDRGLYRKNEKNSKNSPENVSSPSNFAGEFSPSNYSKISDFKPSISPSGGARSDQVRIATDLGTPPHPKSQIGDAFAFDKKPLNQSVTSIIENADSEKVLDHTCEKSDDLDPLNEIRKLRYHLQDHAGYLLFDPKARVNKKGYQVQHPTCSCSKFSKGNGIDISKSRNRAFYSNVMRCSNSRSCPLCSAAIAEYKASELRIAANMREALGLEFSLMTFTVPHYKNDNLNDLKVKINLASRNFWRGGPATRFKKKYGIKGHIRSFEIRWSEKNGWHPHFHFLVISERKLPTTDRNSNHRVDLRKQSDDWKHILGMWQSACERAGLKRPGKYGLDLQNGDKAGEYISKFGDDGELLKTKSGKKVTWDMADELTKGDRKEGNESLSPMQILQASMDAENKDERWKYGKLYRDWVRCSKGLTLLKWGPGTREIFGLHKVEKSDAEIIANQDEEPINFLCNISKETWVFILQNKLRPKILELAELPDGVTKINEYLSKYGLEEVNILKRRIAVVKLLRKVENHPFKLMDVNKSNLIKPNELTYKFRGSGKSKTRDVVAHE